MDGVWAVRLARHRDDLDVDERREALTYIAQSSQTPRADALLDVDMRPNGCVAVADGSQEGPSRPRAHVVFRDRRKCFLHCRERARNVAGSVREPLAEQGLVEMRVRLGGRWEQYVPGEIVCLAVPGYVGPDRGNRPVCDRNVDDLAARDRGVAEEHVSCS